MPQIGEIKKGKELNKKPIYKKFIWNACKHCGSERWTEYLVKKEQPVSQNCKTCSPHLEERNKKISEKRQGKRRKGGICIDSSGYRKVWLPPDDFFYPMVDSSGYVREHRLVMAKYLGRCLHSWEIVHHKGIRYKSNGNRSDNLIDNLQLVSDLTNRQLSNIERTFNKLRNIIKSQNEEIERLNKIARR